MAANFNAAGTLRLGRGDCDSRVDIGDFAILAGNFNKTLQLARNGRVGAAGPSSSAFSRVLVASEDAGPADLLTEELAAT